ncbi:hypothetical protein BCR44DRAFT_1018295 [Catenaria anguillulae PL171]|uniref:Uncharacterized protein n=1 Tax=Catenaria anguillulae PL171 TaxID=765915 RepID=A0A1Y2H6F0_9FUNG|nr:hypothetical protein BCR44DRAFT_1018295 [Catenaria anguillulae PL171]
MPSTLAPSKKVFNFRTRQAAVTASQARRFFLARRRVLVILSCAPSILGLFASLISSHLAATVRYPGLTHSGSVQVANQGESRRARICLAVRRRCAAHGYKCRRSRVHRIQIVAGVRIVELGGRAGGLLGLRVVTDPMTGRVVVDHTHHTRNLVQECGLQVKSTPTNFFNSSPGVAKARLTENKGEVVRRDENLSLVGKLHPVINIGRPPCASSSTLPTRGNSACHSTWTSGSTK